MCPFTHRCKFVNDACYKGFPEYDRLSDTQKAACVLDREKRQVLQEQELAAVREVA